ncbi:hypothetical protein [Pyxidicoccus fallax]|uniref:hypothetical protein n=1 Tax=Pyxidicoccus fallax TaxID=394095 RepID=UPI001B7D5816|nr:hypothetical protein [Pyxidicoccus fallax]
MNNERLGGPYRYTRQGRGVFHLPLARPWTWTLTHHGAEALFITDGGVDEGEARIIHPPDALLGCWLALYATREYDTAAVEWMRRAYGLEAPGGDVLPADCYVAVGRLAEVATVSNDMARATAPESWWWPPGASCRRTVAWWLEEVTVFEPLHAPPSRRLALVDGELLPELRERVRLARDGLWRPEVYPVPAALPLPVLACEEPSVPAPPHHPAPVVDDRPVPPMLHVEQLGLFGTSAPVEPPAAPPTPPQVQRVEAAPLPNAPGEALHSAAERLRALLLDRV